MTCEVKIIADSIGPSGKRITTMQLRYWRAIHAELMTHRVFSRNASSSRAVPVAKMLEQVRNDPAGPIHWGKNQPGMQAEEELSTEYDETIGSSRRQYVKNLWKHAAGQAADDAERMMELGAHKQIANRILEPFQYISVIVTATEWDNFFALRCHPDAQPEIQELANAMHAAMVKSDPVKLDIGWWHLPYVSDEEKSEYEISTLVAISAARCCRVSYLTHDGRKSTVDEDLALCERLAGADPIHASPFEHQATPDVLEVEGGDGESYFYQSPHMHGNLVGWIQNRKLLESKIDPTEIGLEEETD